MATNLIRGITMIRFACVLVSFLFSTSIAFAGTFTLFGMDTSVDSDTLKGNCEFVAGNIQNAKHGDYVGAITNDANICSYPVKEKNPLIQKKYQGKAMNDLRNWYLNQNGSSGSANIANLMRRGFERINAEAGKYKRYVFVICSSGIHNHKGISFVDKYPADSFANPSKKASPFSVIPSAKVGVEVIFITSGGYNSPFHEQKLQGFYSLLCQYRKARLHVWSDDIETAAEYIRSRKSPQKPVPQAEDFNGDLKLFQITTQTSQIEKKKAVVAKTVPKPSGSVRNLDIDEDRNASVWVSGPRASSDMRVSEVINGKRQQVLPDKIRVKSGSDKPLAVVLARDCSYSMGYSDMDCSLRAIWAFLDGMKGNDRAALVDFADWVSVECDFTSDINSIKRHLLREPRRGGTAFYDALAESLRRIEKMDGNFRAVTIALTDGCDHNSRNKPKDIIKLCQKTKTPLILVGLGGVDHKVLSDLADKSGGRYYHKSASELQSLYELVSKDLSNSFIIEYPSGASAGDTVSAIVEYGKEKLSTQPVKVR
jgi:Mg-chelatase subunit ChlD